MHHVAKLSHKRQRGETVRLLLRGLHDRPPRIIACHPSSGCLPRTAASMPPGASACMLQDTAGQGVNQVRHCSSTNKICTCTKMMHLQAGGKLMLTCHKQRPCLLLARATLLSQRSSDTTSGNAPCHHTALKTLGNFLGRV